MKRMRADKENSMDRTGKGTTTKEGVAQGQGQGQAAAIERPAASMLRDIMMQQITQLRRSAFHPHVVSVNALCSLQERLDQEEAGSDDDGARSLVEVDIEESAADLLSASNFSASELKYAYAFAFTFLPLPLP